MKLSNLNMSLTPYARAKSHSAEPFRTLSEPGETEFPVHLSSFEMDVRTGRRAKGFEAIQVILACLRGRQSGNPASNN